MLTPAAIDGRTFFAPQVSINQEPKFFEASMRYSHSVFAAVISATFAATATPALAIKCDGNFQVQKSGERIATPYCADGYLAEVAREYGARTNAREMRWNPNEKARVCRFVGDDNRVRDTCAPYRDDMRRRW